jgi:hypothetical protein
MISTSRRVVHGIEVWAVGWQVKTLTLRAERGFVGYTLILLSQKVADHRLEESIMERNWDVGKWGGMEHQSADDTEARFAVYMEGLVSVIGHADRAGPLRDYCLGLVMLCERKSVEPIAAMTAPERTAAQHQALLHFVGQSPWSDERVLAKVGEMVLPVMQRHGPIVAWIIDDTSYPKKGEHSVGVARQYCGQLGKQDLCFVEIYVLFTRNDKNIRPNQACYRTYFSSNDRRLCCHMQCG